MKALRLHFINSPVEEQFQILQLHRGDKEAHPVTLVVVLDSPRHRALYRLTSSVALTRPHSR